MNTLNPTEPGHAPQEGCDKREKRATETGGGGVAFEIAGERPETSLRVVLKVEVLVSEGSHVNDTRGGEHQTWTERERDANLTPSGVSDIPSLTLVSHSPLGFSHFLARRKRPMSLPPSSMYPIGSETMTSTMSGQPTSSTSPSRTLIRSDRPLLFTKIFRRDRDRESIFFCVSTHHISLAFPTKGRTDRPPRKAFLQC